MLRESISQPMLAVSSFNLYPESSPAQSTPPPHLRLATPWACCWACGQRGCHCLSQGQGSEDGAGALSNEALVKSAKI